MFNIHRLPVYAFMIFEFVVVVGCHADRERVLHEQKKILDIQESQRMSIIESLEFSPVPLDIRFPLCLNLPDIPESAIDVHRSLFVHDRATLDAEDFTLLRTLTQMANQVSSIVPGTTAVSIFRQFRDTQNAAPGAGPGPHCDDNGATINGFPISCPKGEGEEALLTDPEIQTILQHPNTTRRVYIPLALVNRLDLAHEGWRNCGEYRIIYSLGGVEIDVAPTRGETLIIFEAVLPNPKPGCRTGCLPVMQFWKSLSSISDPAVRAGKLAEFFYDGLPGFAPVVHVDHYSAIGAGNGYGGSAGSGQIRTNQFFSGTPWILKEFKTVLDCGVSPCKFEIEPTMVKVNPYGALWNKDVALDATSPFRSHAVAFQDNVLLQKTSLASTDIMDIGYSVDLDHDAGQSVAGPDERPSPPFVDDYVEQMNNAAAAGFRSELATAGLSADQMAMRALSQSCMGCHQLAVQGDIGAVTIPGGATVTRWPSVINGGFRHIDPGPRMLPEYAGSPHFGSGRGQPISPALLDVFLPVRRSFFVNQLNAEQCACVPRFSFLPEVFRPKLKLRDEIIREELISRFNQLNTIARNAKLEEFDDLLLQYRKLLIERDQRLEAELTHDNLVLPQPIQSDAGVRTLKLNAGRNAKGDQKLEAELRTKEVNQLLKDEPPRRTVTGSFAVH